MLTPRQIATLLTIPLPFFCAYDVPIKYPTCYQIFLSVSTWSWCVDFRTLLRYLFADPFYFPLVTYLLARLLTSYPGPSTKSSSFTFAVGTTTTTDGSRAAARISWRPTSTLTPEI